MTSRQRKAAETETALKAAARRVFARQGYLNTRITDITAEAGRAAGSFYKHFAGKEELLEALLADMFAEGDRDAAAADHEADFAQHSAVRWHVAHFWRFYRAHLPEMIALRQAAMVDAGFARRLRQLTAADSEHLIGHFAGLDLPGTPELTLSAMHSLLDQFAYTWLAENNNALPDDEAIDLLTNFLHRAFTGQSAIKQRSIKK